MPVWQAVDAGGERLPLPFEAIALVDGLRGQHFDELIGEFQPLAAARLAMVEHLEPCHLAGPGFKIRAGYKPFALLPEGEVRLLQDLVGGVVVARHRADEAVESPLRSRQPRHELGTGKRIVGGHGDGVRMPRWDFASGWRRRERGGLVHPERNHPKNKAAKAAALTESHGRQHRRTRRIRRENRSAGRT